jgi:membrane-bound ClpP family serine protease
MLILLDPNVGYVLLVLGIILALLAVSSPGTGILELSALLVLGFAGYVISRYPINIWALVVLILGVIPFIIALRRARNWIFLIVSIAAFIVGSIFIIRTASGSPSVNPILASITSVIAAGFVWFIGRRGLEAIGLKPSIDLGRLVGKIGEARTDIDPEGSVYVGGEIWSAKSEHVIYAGSPIRVTGREGLVLIVEAVQKQEES